jgi:hypothetical protein
MGKRRQRSRIHNKHGKIEQIFKKLACYPGKIYSRNKIKLNVRRIDDPDEIFDTIVDHNKINFKGAKGCSLCSQYIQNIIDPSLLVEKLKRYPSWKKT